MKSTKRSIAAIAGCVVLLSAACVFAEDWPQWRGPNRDGKVSGFTAPQKWPATLTQKWTKKVGFGDATPALVGDRLYVFVRQDANEVILCLNAANGDELWNDQYGAQAVTGAAARHPGPRSSPTVADGKVITLGVGGILSCLDAASGKVVWRKDELAGTVPQFFTAMSPIIVDGMCIAHLGGTDNGAIIAFDLASGDPKWRWTGDGPAYSSPVLMTVEGTKQVVVQTDRNLVSVAAADGKLLWQIPTKPQSRFYNSATPIVDGQTVIYTGQGQGTKAVRIEKQGDSFAIKELWTNDQLGTGYNTPVLKDGLLFGLSNQGNLFCVNAQTSKTGWTDTAAHSNFGSIIDAGSVLLALSEKTGLVVYKPDGKEYSQIAQYKVADTPIYAHPVVSDNRIYVKDQDSVAMWIVE